MHRNRLAVFTKLYSNYSINISQTNCQTEIKTRKWWLSESLKESIKTKNKLYVKWLKVNTTVNEATYKTRQIWGIWKLRPAYSPETPNLGQIRRCFVPCDLEIWWMNLESNRASLLCCFKLCATFHSHRWIQTGVTVRKRPIWVKLDDF